MATRLQRPGDQSPFILRTRSEVRKRLSADGSERRSRAPRRGDGAAHTQPRGAAPGGVGPGRPARPVCCAHGPFLPLRPGSGSGPRPRWGCSPPPRGRSPLPRPRALTKRCLSGRSGRPRPAPSANEHAGPGEASSAPNVSTPDRQPGRACAPRPLKAESGGSEMQRREDSRCNG